MRTRQFAESVQSSIQAIISMNESSFVTPSNRETASISANVNRNIDPNTNNATNVYVADELLKLKSLMDSGLLTKEEFENQKQLILRSNQNV